jgi:2-iminoacetate synthase ThiH
MEFIREFKDIFEKVRAGVRLSEEDGIRLINSKNVVELGAMADFVKKRMHGNKAHFTHSINVNHTNICVLSCKFCAWAAKKNEPKAYVMSNDEIERRVKNAASHGVWEVHIVGGLDPELKLAYYEEMLREIKKSCPGVLIQAFTAVELDFYARLEKINIEESFTALLTADIDAITEKILIKSNDLKTDILKIAHHGSRFASSNEFLKAVKPKIAIIEVGSENTYGHPNKETLENLKNAEIPVMRTDINGTIEIKNEKGNLVIFTQKDNK